MQLNLVQIDNIWQDPQTNFAKITALLEKTPPQADSMVFLCEMFATGFTENSALGQAVEGEVSKFLSDTAMRWKCHTCAGMVRGGRNCCVIFGPDGWLIHEYAKQKLFTFSGEHEHYSPGNGCSVTEICGVKVATLVCYDLRFPELFRQAVSMGAELFIVPASWPASRQLHWRTLLQARAIENQACVVGISRIGKDPHVKHIGGSCVFGEKGDMLLDAGEAEGVFSCTIDPEEIRRWRKKFPALVDSGLISI